MLLFRIISKFTRYSKAFYILLSKHHIFFLENFWPGTFWVKNWIIIIIVVVIIIIIIIIIR